MTKTKRRPGRKPKKSKGGRPPKPAGERRDTPVQFKVTIAEREYMNEQMALDGFNPKEAGSLSSWIRERIGLDY